MSEVQDIQHCCTCGTEIEGGRLPFCSMRCYSYHVLGTPPCSEIGREMTRRKEARERHAA